MIPNDEELRKFLKIPKTAKGKLDAMNDTFFKEKSERGALEHLKIFMEYMMLSCPEYIKKMQECKTEEEIAKASEEFFKSNPEKAMEVFDNLLAAYRDRHIDKKDEEK